MSLAIINHNNVDIEVFQIDNDYYILETDLTKAIGADRNTIRAQRRRNPEIYREGRHYLMHTDRMHGRDRIVWSFRGLSRLLMRLNTLHAIQFQDRLEDFLEELRTGKLALVSSEQVEELQTLLFSLREELSSTKQKLQLLEAGYEEDLQKLTRQELGKICKMADHIVRLQHKVHRRSLSKLYPEVWTALHEKYGVRHYRDLERRHLISVIMYLDGQLSVCYLQEKQMQAG